MMKIARAVDILPALCAAVFLFAGCALLKPAGKPPATSLPLHDDSSRGEQGLAQASSATLTPLEGGALGASARTPGFRDDALPEPQPRLMGETIGLKTPQFVDEEADFEEPDAIFDVPVETNPSVVSFIRYFQGPKKDWMLNSLRRAGRYMPRMQSIFREEGLPEDLVYLALIESGFNPYARSRAGAVGIWQFIPETGVRYGLRITPWVDERRDPEKSTRAAARYLKDLYAQFGDWYLAAAAYNCGEKNVEYALQRYSLDNFWHLTQLPQFPTETKEYVPKYLAALMIAKEPHKYGFGRIEQDNPVKYTLVEIPHPTNLKAVAQACDTEPDVLLSLNPELKRACVPESGYKLKVPAGVDYSLLKDLPPLEPVRPANTLRTHRVLKGETLASIARKYNTSVDSIRSANKLARTDRIRAKEVILVPTATPERDQGSRTLQRVSMAEELRPLPSSSSSSHEPSTARGTRVVHEVKKGETLFGISKHYGVDVSAIREWNPSAGSLHPGQRLTLWVRKDADKARSDRSAKSEPVSGPSRQQIIYTVRPGDTLYGIARRHQVSPDEIAAWNNLNGRRSLRAGDQLKIYRPLQVNAKRNEAHRAALKD